MPSASSSYDASRHRGARRGSRALLAAIVVVAVALVGATAAVAVRASDTHTGGNPAPAATPASQHLPPFAVSATVPASGATSVSSDAVVSVSFSSPVAAGGPTPGLTPPVAGTWELANPETYTFVATAPFVPSVTETISVPGGASGIHGTGGQVLPATVTSTFTVAAGTTLRLQQLLAQLGYLPLTFTPATPLASTTNAADPQEGSFAWRFAPPDWLAPQWSVGGDNVLTRGAVMTFEDEHGMTTDGSAGPQVWTALLADAAAGKVTAAPYDYVYVQKTTPESATVYRNGVAVYSTPANTGVAGAPTASGTFPVYLRYTVTTMKGTNPDGTKYSDPGIPWVSYFNGGDALHGFVRSSYGFPQSDGCVELPPANAAVVWPMTPIGTLVTVS